MLLVQTGTSSYLATGDFGDLPDTTDAGEFALTAVQPLNPADNTQNDWSGLLDKASSDVGTIQTAIDNAVTNVENAAANNLSSSASSAEGLLATGPTASQDNAFYLIDSLGARMKVQQACSRRRHADPDQGRPPADRNAPRRGRSLLQERRRPNRPALPARD